MRVPHWPEVLASKIEEWRHVPFEYGSCDCFQFPADVVLAITGVDYREQFANYASREEAEALMTVHRGVLGIIAKALGPSKPVAHAMRADLIAADFGYGLAAGICLGTHCCAPGPAGLVFKPTCEAIAAWST
jgi:hypothetical protein